MPSSEKPSKSTQIGTVAPVQTEKAAEPAPTRPSADPIVGKPFVLERTCFLCKAGPLESIEGTKQYKCSACRSTYGILDPAERAREKQTTRDEDQRRLDAGETTSEELRRENGAFAFPRDRVTIHFPKGKKKF